MPFAPGDLVRMRQTDAMTWGWNNPDCVEINGDWVEAQTFGVVLGQHRTRDDAIFVLLLISSQALKWFEFDDLVPA